MVMFININQTTRLHYGTVEAEVSREAGLGRAELNLGTNWLRNKHE